MPPSGPTTISPVPAAGSAISAIWVSADSCSTSATSAAAMADSTTAVLACSTSGTHSRRDCLAASRAVSRQRSSDFAARSPCQRTMERDACHASTRRAADLGGQLHGRLAAVSLGQRLGDGPRERGSGVGENPRRPRRQKNAWTPPRRRRERRGRARSRAAPTPPPSAASRPRGGPPRPRRRPARRARPRRRSRRGRGRRVTRTSGELAEDALASLGRDGRGQDSSARLGQLAQQLALVIVELGRRLHQQRDAEVARPPPRRRGAAALDRDARPGLRPGLHLDGDRAVGGGRDFSHSASSVATSTVVPSAARSSTASRRPSRGCRRRGGTCRARRPRARRTDRPRGRRPGRPHPGPPGGCGCRSRRPRGSSPAASARCGRGPRPSTRRTAAG